MDYPHDFGDRWDDGDVGALTEMLRTNMTYRDMAAQLGRTKEAVRSKARRLGLR